MNEIALSNDLNVITAEIKMLETNMTKSLVEHGWEIGKRLSHVKKNLKHGEFGDWLKNNFDFSHQYANQFMKFYIDNPNYNSSSNFNKLPSWRHVVEVLYLPTDVDQEDFIENEVLNDDGSAKPTKEVAQLKKQLKQKDELIANMADSMHDFELQARELEGEVQQLKSKPAEVVEKPVVPEDYEGLKESNSKLLRELQKAEYEATTVREAYDSLIKKRHQEDEGSRKYKEMTEAMKEMEGQMTRQQKRIQSQKQVYELVDKSKDLLQAITPIPYLINAEFVNENPVAKRELENIVDQTGKFLDHLNNVLKKTLIIEGEIIND